MIVGNSATTDQANVGRVSERRLGAIRQIAKAVESAGHIVFRASCAGMYVKANAVEGKVALPGYEKNLQAERAYRFLELKFTEPESFTGLLLWPTLAPDRFFPK